MNHEKYFLVSAANQENAILFENVPVDSYSTLSFCLGITYAAKATTIPSTKYLMALLNNSPNCIFVIY